MLFFSCVTVPIVQKTKEILFNLRKDFIYNTISCTAIPTMAEAAVPIKILPFYDKMILYSTENTFT